MRDLEELILAVPDFPSPGIVFRDITPLLLKPSALSRVVEILADRYRSLNVECVAAVESRGFIFGAPLALALGAALAPVRKLGKLPRETRSREYELEYGSNHLEMHVDSVRPGQRVLILDDVLATGGTARAAIDIAEELGGIVVGAAFVIEIAALGGRDRLERWETFSLMEF